MADNWAYFTPATGPGNTTGFGSTPAMVLGKDVGSYGWAYDSGNGFQYFIGTSTSINGVGGAQASYTARAGCGVLSGHGAFCAMEDNVAKTIRLVSVGTGGATVLATYSVGTLGGTTGIPIVLGLGYCADKDLLLTYAITVDNLIRCAKINPATGAIRTNYPATVQAGLVPTVVSGQAASCCGLRSDGKVVVPVVVTSGGNDTGYIYEITPASGGPTATVKVTYSANSTQMHAVAVMENNSFAALGFPTNSYGAKELRIYDSSYAAVGGAVSLGTFVPVGLATAGGNTFYAFGTDGTQGVVKRFDQTGAVVETWELATRSRVMLSGIYGINNNYSIDTEGIQAAVAAALP